jgi:hypothetical protein
MNFDRTKIKLIKSIIQILELTDITSINNKADEYTLQKISKDYDCPIEILNYIITSKTYLFDILSHIEKYMNLEITEDELLKIMKHTEKKKILKAINKYACIGDIKDINRNYIKYEFDREQLRFKQQYPDKEYIYPNQRRAALQVTKSFIEDKKKAVSLIALPQVGKTGTFLYVAYLMTTYNSDDIIEPENIFIITGMSDKAWVIQTKKDMLPQFEKNVYHRAKIDEFKTSFMEKKGKKLLIIDESHYGAKIKQKIDKIFKEIFGIYDKLNILDFDCLILSVSATPGITLKELRDLGKFHTEVYIKPSTKYVSFETFIEQHRIEKSEKISDNFLIKIKNKIDEIYDDNYKYHIFRLNSKHHKTIELFCDKHNYKYKNHYSDDQIDFFDKLLENKPENHTFIIIKGYYRAGKRLNDKYIGIAYEHCPSINMESTPQGLIGRFCGNDKNNNPYDSPYFYCNLEAITQYITHYKNSCDFTNYSSSNLKIKDNIITKHKKTTVSRLENSDYKGHQITQEEYDKIIKDIPHILFIDIVTYNLLCNSNEKQNMIKDIIKNSNNKNSAYLLNILDTYIKGEISHPNTDNSYKKHIYDPYNAHINNKPFSIDIQQKHKNKNIWMAFIDNEKFINKYLDDDVEKMKLIITVYHGEKKLNFQNNK